jgi:1,2-diacylglycerol 3-alpha-glucosyltransferase
MKVLFAVDAYYPHVNGVYHFVRRLASHLQVKGYQVAVMAPSPNMHPSIKTIDQIDVYGIPSFSVYWYPTIRLPYPLLIRKRITQALEQFKPDIIHIQGHFMLTKALLEVNQNLGIPMIGTNHFMPENLTVFMPTLWWKKRLERVMWQEFTTLFNQLSLVTVPTEPAARYIRQKLSVEVMPISNGIDLDKFRPSEPRSDLRIKYGIPDRPVLLTVGRLDPEKKLDHVLRATAGAMGAIDFCLVIVGKGVHQSALKRLARSLGITDRVVFTGYVPDEDLPFLYAMSRCFITASIAELQSIATMEAMASGLPVIAANAGALGELVHDHTNGYLFETGDILQMARFIYRLFTQDVIFRDMGERSTALIKEHDIRKTLAAYEAIYAMYGRDPQREKDIQVIRNRSRSSALVDVGSPD